MITFTKQEDGRFQQSGSIETKYGVFQWLHPDTGWKGYSTIESLEDLLARMRYDGPYSYDQYRILPASKEELVIKPTCASCGIIAGVDCQDTCAYIFGKIHSCEKVTTGVTFNDNHQFNLSIPVVVSGKHFGKKRAKMFWFNSVRCAELFLLENAVVKHHEERIGAGDLLLKYLDVKLPKAEVEPEQEPAQSRPAAPKAKRVTPVENRKPAVYRCANKACGFGQDDKGNRIRAQVESRGTYCSKACQTMMRQAEEDRSDPTSKRGCQVIIRLDEALGQQDGLQDVLAVG